MLPASFVILAEEITCRGSIVGGSLQIKQGSSAKVYDIHGFLS
jgi:hypothetical protein